MRVGGCPAVVAQWQSTGGSSQRCPGFDSRWLPAFFTFLYLCLITCNFIYCRCLLLTGLMIFPFFRCSSASMGPCVTVNTKGIVNNWAGLGMRQKWGAPNGFIVFFVVGSPPPALMSYVHRTSFLIAFLFSHYCSTSTCTIVNTN